MDNLPVHNAEAVDFLMACVGVQVKFLPPYSPDLCPIKLCLSKIQAMLGSEAARNSNAVDEAITQAINAINDEDALNWVPPF